MEMDSTYINIVRKQATDLIESVHSFSNAIPDEKIYELRLRLIKSASEFPEIIERTFSNEENKLRNVIKANVKLGEINDYLKLADELKYSNSDDLIEKVRSVSRLITNGYPFLAV